MRLAIILVVPAFALVACGATYQLPAQRLADAQAAERSASEVGAATDPQAQLHLKLAQEQIAQAKTLIDDGQTRRADYVLVRAKSDAELALALARESHAKAEAKKAMDQVAALQSNPNGGGAQ